jgi:class 3 adenylate cyclase/pimeloyl-ACP methyl ester carboxylesterase
MSEAPPTRYVEVSGSDVAYSVAGAGAVDLLYFWGLGSHVDLLWDRPGHVQFFDRLCEFSRLILFDRRGTGASDRLDGSALLSWESSVEDLLAVLDAAGSRSAYIYANVDAGPAAIKFAVDYPERVSGLILGNTSARFLHADDYPIGVPEAVADQIVEFIRTSWGTEQLFEVTAADAVQEREFVAMASKMNRASMTPRAATTLYSDVLRTADVRALLGLIDVPVLVMHNDRNPLVPLSHGEYLARHIAGARFVTLDAGGISQSPRSLSAEIDLLAEFVTGEPSTFGSDSFLTTLLVCDIVDSTGQVTRLGDEVWRRRLDGHDRAVRAALRRYGGTEVAPTGDGFLAMFDSPSRAIRCGWEIVATTSKLGFSVRVGVHSGECIRRGADLAGVAIHVATRIGSAADGDQVLVSDAVRAVVTASDISFVEAGCRDLKGIPGPVPVFTAVPATGG